MMMLMGEAYLARYYCILFCDILRSEIVKKFITIKMKKMKTKTITLSVLITCLITSCNYTAPDQENSEVDQTKMVNSEDLSGATFVKPSFTSIDAKLAAQVQNVYSSYLKVQLALVGDKSTEAAANAAIISQLIKAFDTVDLPLEQKQVYESLTIPIVEIVTIIGNSTDIKVQRTYFSPLSDHVFELTKAFGSDIPVYQVHCPMAFDNKGASWLSSQTAIRNPYFGDEMLECGEVIKVIRK
jgi:hypothetical protein